MTNKINTFKEDISTYTLKPFFMKKILLLMLAGISFGGTQAGLPNSSPEPGLATLSSFISYVPAQFTAGKGIIFTDPYESNETLSTAASIPVNAFISATISSSTDIDYYKFYMRNNRDFTIVLSNLPANYDIELYNSAGTLLSGSYNSGTTSEVISYYSSTLNGYYYLRVSGYNGANSADPYELEIQP